MKPAKHVQDMPFKVHAGPSLTSRVQESINFLQRSELMASLQESHQSQFSTPDSEIRHNTNTTGTGT